MQIFKNLRKKWEYRKAVWRFRSRKITRAKLLYWYFIFSGISMFAYGISCVFTGFPLVYIFGPVALLVVYFVLLLTFKNWKLIWLYVKDMDRGRFLMYLNKNSNFSEMHKKRTVRWVYLAGNEVRNERWLELSEKVRGGNELTTEEKIEYRKKVVICPQQVMDGVNKAILINALIYAHVNINVLDDNIRDILDLTDENMNKFDLQKEINRCKRAEAKSDADKYIKKGKDILKKKKK